MPTATYSSYCRMLDRARQGEFAYPAINVSSTDTANAAVEGFARARSDGIVQVSIGGGAHASGTLKDSVLGAITLAEHVRRVADRHEVTVALHTDHCQPDKVDSFLRPLIAETAQRRGRGEPPLFNSHMFDGSELPLGRNLDLAVELLRECHDNELILEVETGVVGGEEDGVSHDAPGANLYTTPEEMLSVHERLSAIEGARFLYAATFGNVHGVYKPGRVRLRPEILRDGQRALGSKHEGARFDFVFHGGSGSSIEEIRETLGYGVVKMNIDTDTQYAFTRAVADHVLKGYDAVLRVDGEVGDKKQYDPRRWLAKARSGMAERVVRACEELRSTGRSMTAGA